MVFFLRGKLALKFAAEIGDVVNEQLFQSGDTFIVVDLVAI